MTTRPRPPIWRVERRDVPAAKTPEPNPVASKPTRRSPDVNDLIADPHLGAIPLDARRSGDLAASSLPDPPVLFKGIKIASLSQRADLDAARLLDCAPSSSPVPGQNRNPLEILAAL